MGSKESGRQDSLLSSIEPDEQALANGHLVDHLGTTASPDLLPHCPRWLREVLEKNAWRHFAHPYTKQVYDYEADGFDQFVKARCPAGLGIADGVAGLIRICEVVKGENAAVSLRLIRDM